MSNCAFRRLAPISLLLGALASAASVGGCNGIPHTTSRETLGAMRAEPALKQMQSDVDSWKGVGSVAGMVDRNLQTLAEEHQRSLESLNTNVQNQIKTASTPEDALREMVEDVSAYLMTELPKDAKRRGMTDYRINVAMGELINRNNDPRLNSALALIRSNLINNSAFTNQFRLLATTSKQRNEIIDEIAGKGSSGWTNPGGDPVGFIDPKDIYVVEGRTYLQRGGYKNHQLTVFTEITAFHPDSNEAFASTVIRRTYSFHPMDERFLTEGENSARAASLSEAESRVSGK